MNIVNLYLRDVLGILSQKHKLKLIIFILFFLLSTILEMIGIGFVIPVMEAVSNYSNFSSRLSNLDFINISDYKKDFVIKIVIGLLLVIYTIKNIFLTILSYLQFKFLKNIKFELGNIAFDVYLKKNFINHLNTNSSKIIRNINDTTFATETIKNLMVLISETLVVIGISTFLFIFQPISTIICLILMIVFVLVFQFFFHEKSKLYGEGRFQSEEKKLKLTKDIFGSIKDIKIEKKENFFLKKFNDTNEMLTKYEMKQNFLTSIPRYWLEWTTIFVMVVLIFYFVNLKLNPEEYFIILGVFAAAAFRLMPSFSRIILALQRMKFTYPVLKEFNEIVFNQNQFKIKKINTIKKKFDFKNNIKFENVSFYYSEKNRKVFENLNFQINKGEYIGIYGKSGSGKSTFISILTGLLKNTSGKILVDNDIDIHEPHYLDDWQKKIGYVPQNIFIHDSSVLENVAFGVEKNLVNILKVKRLLKSLQLNDLAKDLEKNKLINLGEYGDKISGGQKQRLGIARALYSDPEILILDESTSALDKENEEKIIDDLIKLKINNITIIVVSHRETALKKCDRKLSIDNFKGFK
tara:strand:+ start:13714 stop:15453 length:1740 start_codon:yes stop_codon:yes gene_type:complete